MTSIDSVCVYCGASTRVDPSFTAAAFSLGQKIAQAGIQLVYGGGRLGLMGAVADGALSEGGKVVGYMPTHLQDMEQAHTGLTESHIVKDMHTRKRCMFERSDAFVALPGGFGTMDETFEIVTWKQINLHDKPLVLVNINGYWDPLRKLVENTVNKKFAKDEHLNHFNFLDRVDDVVPFLKTLPDERFPAHSEYI